MKKFISCVIGAFMALTISGVASASLVGGIGQAAGDVIEGAGNAVEGAVNGVVDGAENVIDGIVGNGNGNGEGHGQVLGESNEGETSSETSSEEETTSKEETSSNASTTVKSANEANPSTGSFEVVTFGALALGSLAIAAASARKRK